MLAASEYTNRYPEQVIYESEWMDSIPKGASWMNLLTAETIPEETDVIESPCLPERKRIVSNCSSTSVESCYVVLEIQLPRSSDDISSKQEDEDEEEDEEEEEEEEEIEEEIEELNFAQMKHDDHKVDIDQFAVSMTTEVNQINVSSKSQLFI
jgi:hypothetical protein